MPFVRMCHGVPSGNLWGNSCGTLHVIPQGDGGEQGLNSFMPVLFAAGQHGKNGCGETTNSQRRTTCSLSWTKFTLSLNRGGWATRTHVWGPSCGARMRVRGGTTEVWNRAGLRRPICDVLEKIASATDPTSVVWKRSVLPSDQQGSKVLGTDYVSKFFLRECDHQTSILLEQNPDLQSACPSCCIVQLHVRTSSSAS